MAGGCAWTFVVVHAELCCTTSMLADMGGGRVKVVASLCSHIVTTTTSRMTGHVEERLISVS